MSTESAVVPLARPELATLAPFYETMRESIMRAESVDEIARITDVAVAAQAYYRQSRDIENEMGASRIRLRAERKLGEKLRVMRKTGERKGDGKPSHGATVSTLADLGIPRDRASRAMQLAEVPDAQFDAALAESKVAQPRRILREAQQAEPELVPITQTLDLWGRVRDLGQQIEGGELPDLAHWRTNLQPFQLDHLRQYIPVIVSYLSAIQQELDA